MASIFIEESKFLSDSGSEGQCRIIPALKNIEQRALPFD